MNHIISEGIKLSGHLTITVRDAKTDEILRVVENDNLIVDAGLNLVRDMILGTGLTPSHIAIGLSATAPAAGDTTLGSEVFRGLITRRTANDKLANMQLFLDTTSGNGNTLKEAGIFTRSSGGTMLSRVTYPEIVKTSSLTVTFTWDITLA